MNIILFVLYLIAGIAYAVHFGNRGRLVGRFATTMLASATLAHTFIIGMRTMQVGHLPLVGTTGAISMFVWLLAIAYLYTETTSNERSIGTLIAPLLAGLQLIPAVTNYRVVERPPILESPWFALHVSSLLFAYASFAIACVIGITYLLLFKELKAKHLGVFYARLPSLHILDYMNTRAIAVGWLFLTVGLIVGGVWTSQAHVDGTDPRMQAMTLLDPKIFVALFCWVIYSFELYAHRAMGWTGRRIAWLSTFGFVIVLLNFVPIGYFLTSSHNF